MKPAGGETCGRGAPTRMWTIAWLLAAAVPGLQDGWMEWMSGCSTRRLSQPDVDGGSDVAGQR